MINLRDLLSPPVSGAWPLAGVALFVGLSGCAAPPASAPTTQPPLAVPATPNQSRADSRAAREELAPAAAAASSAPVVSSGDMLPLSATRQASPSPVPDPMADLIRYFYQIRLLNGPQLTAEIERFDSPPSTGDDRLRLALALVQTLQLAETQRALGLVQDVLEAPDERSETVKPLAHLLGHLLREQRRLDLQNDRLSQQLRDHQRRVEQLNDRIEAMRAIERSLNRPAPRPVPNR